MALVHSPSNGLARMSNVPASALQSGVGPARASLLPAPALSSSSSPCLLSASPLSTSSSLLCGMKVQGAEEERVRQAFLSKRWGGGSPGTRQGLVLATATAPAAFKTTPFAHVKTRDQLLQVIRGSGMPANTQDAMLEFYTSYEEAVVSSKVPDAEAKAVRIMGAVFDRIALQITDPYTFPSHHLSIREPYDYYAFGQNYVGALLDFETSFVGNVDLLDAMVDQVAEGHNIILLANHQTEADPGVLAHMLEARHPSLATGLTYVAGDRVVLDPFCKPFSMGRNLLCVHSKKRIYDEPALAESKLAANRRTLKEMAKLFKRGGNFIWIAPSGGRDRPDPVTDEWVPAPFDPSAVELMRRLVEDAGRPYHLHPLALLCYDIMPPPRNVAKELGEKRVIGWHGVGISAAPEVDFATVTAGTQDRKEARDVFSSYVYAQVTKHYDILYRAIHGGEGQSASTPGVKLSQPWKA